MSDQLFVLQASTWFLIRVNVWQGLGSHRADNAMADEAEAMDVEVQQEDSDKQKVNANAVALLVELTEAIRPQHWSTLCRAKTNLASVSKSRSGMQ